MYKKVTVENMLKIENFIILSSRCDSAIVNLEARFSSLGYVIASFANTFFKIIILCYSQAAYMAAYMVAHWRVM